MKIYIASSSSLIEQCKALAARLEKELGFTITRKWWDHYIKDEPKFRNITDDAFYAHVQVGTIRELDFKAVRDADFVVVITKDEYKLTGAMVELGYALAHNKPVFLLGKFQRSAMISSCMRATDEDELVEAFKRFS